MRQRERSRENRGDYRSWNRYATISEDELLELEPQLVAEPFGSKKRGVP